MKLSKVLALIMCCVFMFSCYSFNSVASEKKDTVEIAILIDVSGSMAFSSDPLTKPLEEGGTRRTIEAVEQFGLIVPEMYDVSITLIPYSHTVYVFDKVDLPKDVEKYKNNVKDILRNEIDEKPNVSEDGEVYEHIDCWASDSYTDIGLAMETAKNTLDKSSADKKAVVLFTDGEIVLKNPEDDVEASKQKAFKSAKALEDAGVSVYSIGLDANDKDYVDKKFLAEMHGVSNINDSENIHIIHSATKVSDVFNKVSAQIYDLVMPEPGPDDIYPVTPYVEVERTFRVFENAARGVRINFSSNNALKTFRVENPNGVVVAYVDLDDPSENNVDTNICKCENTTSKNSAVINLINYPSGGEWKVYVTGEQGVVVETTLLDVVTDIHDSIEEGSVHYIGDTLIYKASLYNEENGTQLTDSGLFSTEFDANGIVTVTNLAGGSSPTMNLELDPSGIVYNGKINFNRVGEYSITTVLTHKEYKETSSKKITVVAPNIAVTKQDDFNGFDPLKINVKLLHPVTGEPINEIPTYMQGAKCLLNITDSNGKTDEFALNLNELLSGTVKEYNPDSIGNFSISAVILSDSTSDQIILAESNKLDVEFKASEIVLVGELPKSIEKKAFSGVYEEIISLEGIFKDLQDNPVNIEAIVDGDDVISATVDGNNLIVKTSDFGAGTVIVKATNKDGYEQTVSINVSIESLVPTVITICCVVLALVIIAAIAFLIIRKKQIISIGFDLKIEKLDKKAVFTVTPSGNRSVKPKMNLQDLLNNSCISIPQNNNTDMSGADIDSFKRMYASNITVTGVPFKREIKIIYKNKDEEGQLTKRVFNGRGVENFTVGTDEDKYSVEFGESGSFSRAPGYDW